MGLMDKVKQGAGQALTKAQQGVNQGKAKLDQAQAKHQWDGLLRNLGEAVYAEQRQGGPADAVTAALSALDEHAATHGTPDVPLDEPAEGADRPGQRRRGGGWGTGGRIVAGEQWPGSGGSIYRPANCGRTHVVIDHLSGDPGPSSPG